MFALAVPDTDDCILLCQGRMFWIHHITLLVTPIVLLWNERFPLYEHDWLYHWFCALSLLFILHYDLQLIAGVLCKINVNYMILPPPGMFPAFCPQAKDGCLTCSPPNFKGQKVFTGKWYRPQLAMLIIVASLGSK